MTSDNNGEVEFRTTRIGASEFYVFHDGDGQKYLKRVDSDKCFEVIKSMLDAEKKCVNIWEKAARESSSDLTLAIEALEKSIDFMDRNAPLSALDTMKEAVQKLRGYNKQKDGE